MHFWKAGGGRAPAGPPGGDAPAIYSPVTDMTNTHHSHLYRPVDADLHGFSYGVEGVDDFKGDA